MKRLPLLLLASVLLSSTLLNAADPALQNGSFELPKVEKRMTEMEGGNPCLTDQPTDWAHFILRAGKKEGSLAMGMTDEIARTGKQSIYFDFDKLKARGWTAMLMTSLIPAKALQPYKISLWGRLDRKRPITLDQRRPYLRFNVEFYKADEETQVGETEYRTVRIPGSLGKLLFTSAKWSQAYGIVRAPEGAELMKITIACEAPSGESDTDGTIFFDDATIEELPDDFPIAPSNEIIIEDETSEAPEPLEPTEVEPAPVPTPEKK